MFLKNDTKIKAAAFLIALVTVLVYLPAVRYDFVNWDDQLNIYENMYIRSLDSGLLKYMFSFKDTMWIPLTRFSHALNYALWGLDPAGHHLVNIVFHGFNTFLVVILVVRLMEHGRFPDSFSSTDNRKAFLKNALVAAGVTGVLFGLHPLRVESVVWVTERKDVLSGFFVLLSLLYYLKSVSTTPEKKRRVYYVSSIICFIMALMSKPIAVILPVVLVILDVYPLERLKFNTGFTSQYKIVLEKIPFFALSLLLSAVTLLSYKSEGMTVTVTAYSGFTDKLFIAVRSICFYLVKMLWPAGLVPFYQYPSNVHLLTPEYTGSLVLFSLITAFCIYSWKKQKLWSAVWVYFIVALLPVLGILQFGAFAAADRYTYLPSIGPFILIGLGTASIYRNISAKYRENTARIFAYAVIVLITSLLSALTLQQMKIWQNSIALWTAQLTEYPDSYIAYKNISEAYANAGRYDDAMMNLNRAIEIHPGDPKIYYNRGIGYGRTGQHQKAIEDFQRAINLDPRDARYYNELGVAYGSLGNYQQAIENLNIAIRLDPQYEKAYFYRGFAYKSLNMQQDAIRDFQKAARMGYKNAQDYLKTLGMNW